MAETIWDAFHQDIVLQSKDWGYEQECRLILNGLLEDSLDEKHRKLTYVFASLKGMIFGFRTSDENKQKIIEVVQRKCQENHRKDFKLFQAYYSSAHKDIHKFEIPLPFAEVNETVERKNN